MADRDIPKEIPADTKPNDNIVAKLVKENTGKVGGAQGTDRVAPGADKANVPKLAITSDTVKGAAVKVAEVVKQLTPDFHNPAQVVESGKALATMVGKAINQIGQGDRKPAENLSQAIDQSAKVTVAHVGNLNKQVNSVQASMDKARVGSTDTNMA